jgi:hypothetical protein
VEWKSDWPLNADTRVGTAGHSCLLLPPLTHTSIVASPRDDAAALPWQRRNAVHAAAQRRDRLLKTLSRAADK